ncbi:helix-turn-helix transcriptional regulator [Pseudomonas sp. GX19020]|uniref:helix-turn-helix domain-containing protein n=1 Tax=Pseudomonas sp. GX19020 TaxID=2942277 RepID=UPI002019D3EF|nr:helix-turn-helix transcriptional regulator [Pseudomonas sp. GX19020]MCL4068927.1 helix-turn-helix transcriptional regulator [Pseudomonas sp. GX19020]
MSYLSHLKTAAEMLADVAVAARARRIALNMTQTDLSVRSGVAIATLRRFEAGGPATLATVLAVAESLNALVEFSALFPLPGPNSLDDLDARQARKRVSKVKAV